MAKFSEALRDNINNLGIKTDLTLFAVTFYGPATDISVVIPTLPTDVAIVGSIIRLATFTVNDTGTGLTWDSSVGGTISRAAAETASGTCVAAGYPRFFRIHLVTDTYGNAADTSKFRIQGTLGKTLIDASTGLYNDGILDTTFYPMVLSTVYPLGNIPLTLPLE